MKRSALAALLLPLLMSACSNSNGSQPSAAGSATNVRSTSLDVALHQRTFNNYDQLLTSYNPDSTYDETVLSCMANEGFEYVTPPPPELPFNSDELRLKLQIAGELEPDSAEFRETFGYGISTLWSYFVIDAIGDPALEPTLVMDQAEAQEYTQTLYGDGETPGCHQLGLEATDQSTPVVDDFELAYRDTQERVLADSTYLAAADEWAQCAADLGYDIADPNGIWNWAQGLLRDIEEPLVDELPGEMTEEEMELREQGMSEEPESLFGTQRSPYPPEALAQVQQLEIAAAIELSSCDAELNNQIAPVVDRIAAETFASYDIPMLLS